MAAQNMPETRQIAPGQPEGAKQAVGVISQDGERTATGFGGWQ